MPTRRQRRLNGLLEQELSILLLGRLDDPRLLGIRVTRVETTQDLSTAKVYVTRLSDDEDSAEMLEALVHAEPFIRSQLSDLSLRRLPHLVFARDTQFESGQRVLDILAGLRLDQDEELDEAAGAGPSSDVDEEPAGEPDSEPHRAPGEPDSSEV